MHTSHKKVEGWPYIRSRPIVFFGAINLTLRERILADHHRHSSSSWAGSCTADVTLGRQLILDHARRGPAWPGVARLPIFLCLSVGPYPATINLQHSYQYTST